MAFVLRLLGVLVLGTASSLAAAEWEPIVQVGFCPNYIRLTNDGKYIVGSNSFNQSLELSKAETGELVRRFGDTSSIMEFGLSSDSQWVAAAQQVGQIGEKHEFQISIWKLETGELVQKIPIPRNVWKIAFGPENKSLILGTFGEFVAEGISVIEIPSGKILHTFPEAFGGIVTSHDGKTLAYGIEDRKKIAVRELPSGKLRGILPGHQGDIYHLAMSADGKRLLSGSTDKTAIVWDLEKLEQRAAVPDLGAVVYDVDFSHDGKLYALVLTGTDYLKGDTAIVGNAETGEQLQTIKKIAMDSRFIRLTGDGKSLLTQGTTVINDQGGPVASVPLILWEPLTGKKVRDMGTFPRVPASVGFTAEDSLLVTDNGRGKVLVWDLKTGELQNKFQPVTARLKEFVTSNNGLVVMQYHHPGRDPILANAADGKILQKFQRKSEATQLYLHPDGKLLAAAYNDGRVILWDTESGTNQREFAISTNYAPVVTLRSDLERMATAQPEGTLQVWNLKAVEKPLSFPREQPNRMKDVALSHDGKFMASSIYNVELAFWDLAAQKQIHRFYCQADNVTSMALHPRENQIVTGMRTRQAILWDMATGKEIHRFPGHRAEVTGVRFSHDGTRLATISWDGSTRVWDVASGKELVALYIVNDQDDWLAVTPDGHYDGTEEGLKFLRFRRAAASDLKSAQDMPADLHVRKLLAKLAPAAK